jgi:hypothetical protein
MVTRYTPGICQALAVPALSVQGAHRRTQSHIANLRREDQELLNFHTFEAFHDLLLKPTE